MIRNVVWIPALLVVGCATAPNAACPQGQEPMRTAQLFFGRNVGDKPDVTEAAFRAYVDEELTPRFPDGLTILDGGGQWRGSENQLIREAAKVVIIVMPRRSDAQARLNAARDAYKRRFRQEAVLAITQSTCVSF